MAKHYAACKVCHKDLTEEYTNVGFCPSCAKTELRRIKAYFRSALIRGTVLFVIVFAAIYTVKIVYAGGRVNYTGNNPLNFVFTEWLNTIAALTIWTQLGIGLLCFLIPAGHYIELDYGSPRGGGEDGIITLAILLLEVVASVVTAPVKIVRNARRFVRLRDLLRAA